MKRKKQINFQNLIYNSPDGTQFIFFFDLEELLKKCGYDSPAFLTCIMTLNAAGQSMAYHPTPAITFEKVLLYKVNEVTPVLDHLCWNYLAPIPQNA